MRHISKTVWILSLVSLCTDMASEMLYPIMPIYLKSIGFSVVLIGLLEGIAEAVAGLSKGYFGKLSDTSQRRVPFVQLGYAFSAISKPMMAMFIFPLWIFAARTIDRIGKGIRTGARDALLSDEATPATKGKIFGFHRSMDTLGAVLGPSIALLYLYKNPAAYKTLLYLAFIPGFLAILLTFLLKESKKHSPKIKTRTSFLSFLSYWKVSPSLYRKVVIGLLIFTLGNSSDVFLLLQAKQVGFSDTQVIGVYIFYNLVYAIFAFPLGILADKFGLQKVFILGILMFTVVYTGMAFNQNIWCLLILFFIYGLYAAATEGVSKAWISNIADKKETATAIGTFTGFQSIVAMLSSSLTGIIWYNFGSTMAFLLSATIAFLVALYFITFHYSNKAIIEEL